MMSGYIDKNVVGVWGLVQTNQRLPTGSESVVSAPNPKHQLDKAGYNSIVSVSVSETEKSVTVSKQCKCSHPAFMHELEAFDSICRTDGCYCWGFVPLAVSEVV